MTSDWRSTTLGEIADYLNGFPFKPAHLSGSALPVIRIRQLIDPAEAPDRTDMAVPEKHRIDDGDIVFSWSATLAVRIWDRGPALLNQHLFKVVPEDGLEPGWVALALEHSIDGLAEKSHGTTMKHVTKRALSSHPVAVPPREEQRRIVDLIGSIDTCIDSLEGQIDATRTARAGMLSELLSNPGDDWRTTTLGQLSDPAKPICYGVLKPGPDVDGGVPLIKIVDMTATTIEASAGLHRISHSLDEEFSRSRLTGGEVLLSIQGTVGRVAVVGSSLRGANISRTIARIDSGDSEQNRFLRLWLEHASATGLLHTVGTTRASLNIGEIKKTKLGLPPASEQRRIVDLIGSFDEQISSLDSQVESARALRSGVLSELLSGERLLDDSYDMAVGL